jgi:hypothetical protein
VGTNHQLWVVDLEEIRGVWASRDEALLARLDAPRDSYTAHLLGVGQRMHQARRGALIEILVGGACDLDAAHHYHYAFEAICAELRDPEGSSETSTRVVYRLEAHVALVSSRIVPQDVTWPVPLPESPEYPFVGWVDRTQVASIADELATLVARVRELAVREPEGELAQHDDALVLAELERTYRTAAARGRDVVVFTH